MAWNDRRRLRWLRTWLLLTAALLCVWMGRVSAAETVTYYYTSPQGTVLATTDSAGHVLDSAD
jgi:hypothetical protein